MVKIKHYKVLLAGITGTAAFAAFVSGGSVSATGNRAHTTQHAHQKTSSWNAHSQHQSQQNHQWKTQQYRVRHPHPNSQSQHQGLHQATQHTRHQSNAHTHNQYNQQNNHHYQNTYGLRMELKAHAAATVPALKAHYMNSADRYTWDQKVDMNSVSVAQHMDKKYPGIYAPFLGHWREHVTYYKNYLHAAKQQDHAAMAHWKYKLNMFSDQMSTLLAGYDHSLNKYTLKHHFMVHGNQVTAIIDNIVAHNEYQVQALSVQAIAHMGMMADMFVQAHDS